MLLPRPQSSASSMSNDEAPLHSSSNSPSREATPTPQLNNSNPSTPPLNNNNHSRSQLNNSNPSTLQVSNSNPSMPQFNDSKQSTTHFNNNNLSTPQLNNTNPSTPPLINSNPSTPQPSAFDLNNSNPSTSQLNNSNPSTELLSECTKAEDDATCFDTMQRKAKLKRKRENERKDMFKKLRAEQSDFKKAIGMKVVEEISNLSQKVGNFIDTATETLKTITNVCERVGEAAIKYFDSHTNK